MKVKKILLLNFALILFFGCNNISKNNEIIKSLNKAPDLNDSILKVTNSNSIKIDSIKKIKNKKPLVKIEKEGRLKVLINLKTYYKKNASDYLYVANSIDGFCYIGNTENIHQNSFLDTKKSKTYDITTGVYYEFVYCGGPISSEKKDINGHKLNPPDSKPEYVDGIEKLNDFYIANYNIPDEITQNNQNVVVSFVVEKSGELSDIKVIRDLGYGTGKEAMRVMQLSKKWIPAEIKKEKTRVLYSVSINFSNPEIKVSYGFK